MRCDRCGVDHLEKGVSSAQIPEEWCRGALVSELGRLHQSHDALDVQLTNANLQNQELRTSLLEIKGEMERMFPEGYLKANAAGQLAPWVWRVAKDALDGVAQKQKDATEAACDVGLPLEPKVSVADKRSDDLGAKLGHGRCGKCGTSHILSQNCPTKRVEEPQKPVAPGFCRCYCHAGGAGASSACGCCSYNA